MSNILRMTIEKMDEEILNFLRLRVSKELFEHSLGVSRTASLLALKQGIPEKKAILAGLLHDCARELAPSALLTEAKTSGLLVDSFLQQNPLLLHGHVGALVIKRELGIKDREVLEAVTYHTCGKKNMGTLARIIYLADMIEPLRGFSGVEELRQLADTDFRAGMVKAIEITITRVLKKRLFLHPATIDFWNELLHEEKEKRGD